MQKNVGNVARIAGALGVYWPYLGRFIHPLSCTRRLVAAMAVWLRHSARCGYNWRWLALPALCIASSLVEAQTSSVLQANSIVTGGETRPASTSLQPATAITIEAWVTAPSAMTNYPALVS
jgi:hypothetical protein